MAELNTLAPKKWVANYSGAAPTIDITDGVLVGDFAIDTSNDAIWRCLDNTDTAPVWRRLDLIQEVSFDTNEYTPAAHVEGKLYYDADAKTIALMTDVNGTVLQIGQEMYLRVTNKTGSQINNGQVVYVNGAQGSRPTIALADADLDIAHKVVGFATNDIANNGTGYVTTFGLVHDVNTAGISEGSTVYLSQTAGAFTGTEPSHPAHSAPLGIVLLSDATTGIILANIDNASKRLEELLDVSISSRALNDILQFNGAVWVNVAEPTFNKTTIVDNLILPKTSGKGIQVDINNPVFGWRDITADIQVKGGSNTPTWSSFSGNIWGFEFDAVNDQVWISFHIPHDYVPGTDLYIHAHWGLQTAQSVALGDTGNALTWTYYTSYASRNDVTYDTFPAETTDTTTHTIGSEPDIPALGHIVSEVQLTSGGALNGNTIEVDGILLASIKLTANTLDDNPFLFFVDIHYQSTNMATRSREPNFYDDNEESSSSSESSEGFSSSSSSVTNSTSSVA